MIDTHLGNLISTNMEGYKKTGNQEAMWEDLIFMNFMLNFKSIIKANAENSEIGNYEYGVHLPTA